MRAMGPEPLSRPKNAVVVLLDSLNRHMLGAYGGSEFATPNLDRFAARSLKFERHYTGSLPCMPARHDILCGALDFLWKPWGSVELWEDPITVPLRAAGVTTMLVTDHPHLFEVGGENYHTDFFGWEYERGHESDPWKTRPDPSWLGAPQWGREWMPYDNSRGYFRDEPDFPGPRTMRASAEWLSKHAPNHDRFFLFVDEFDPHEPFDTPEPYATMYDEKWDGAHLIWPPYVRGGAAQGIIDDRQTRQLRAQYGGKLTMIDHWFGRLMDALDEHDLWDDTAVIVCTDHGHYLGEHDNYGKPRSPIFEELGHIPMMVAWPGVAAGNSQALTTSVDIHATMMDMFGVTAEHRTHGTSLIPLISGEATEVRPWALSGIWGREVQLVYGDRKFSRAPAGENAPISMWSNRWSTMPVVSSKRRVRMPMPDDRAYLDRMPGSTIPVIRQPFVAGDMLPYWAMGGFEGDHMYDLSLDPGESENRGNERAAREAAHNMRDALQSIDAPADQLERLGLA
jgi:arylsulfatase A-like enzyme